MSEEEILKEGVLLKMSQQKKKLSPRNFKERLFVLTRRTLIYYEQEKGKKKRKKGSILTERICCVEKVQPETIAPVERTFPIQILHDDLILYLFAKDDPDRSDWLAALTQGEKFTHVQCEWKYTKYSFVHSFIHSFPVIRGNDKLSTKCHKGLWVDGVFQCCGQAMKNAPGCCDWHPECLKIKADGRNRVFPSVPSTKHRERTHLPPIPEDEGGACVQVVAVCHYAARKPEELSLVKGNRYVALERMLVDWWKIRDSTGSEGLVPSIHLEKVDKHNSVEDKMSRTSKKTKDSTLTSRLSPSSTQHLKDHPWYVGNMARVKTEQLLREKGKEGAFVVRDSSQKGVYTVSLFSRALDKVNGTVRHYLINVNADGLFYLAEKHLFDSIPQMIEYHQHNGAGLLTRLRLPALEADPTSHSAQDVWELRREDIGLVKELGSGQFGVVQLGLWKDKHQVAIKMVKDGCMSSEEFIQEAQIMMKLQHPKLVRLHGVCSECFPIYIVTEFMSNGCLLDFLRHHGKELQPHRLLRMCLDVCEAMAYLEEQQFIHRDLAARNCLVDKDLSVKVSDFGMARYVLDDQYTSSAGTKFPVKWSPPEVLTYTRFSSRSDVWAFGVLMWEVYSLGKQPYEHYDNARVAERVMQGHRLYRPQLATDRIYQVMKSCWHKLPERRPDFQQLLTDITALVDDDEEEKHD